MKWKFLFVFIVIISLTFFIYFFNQDKKIYYVDIKDSVPKKLDYNNYIYNNFKKENKLEKYISNFSNKDYRITDLIKDIEQNKMIDNQTIQNALIKADIITLKIGSNELNYKINNDEINELFEYCDTLTIDLENLFKLVRKYSKEQIYFIGLYNNHSEFYNEIYDYLNLKIEDLCNEYDIVYIKASNLDNRNNNIKISEKIDKFINK